MITSPSSSWWKEKEKEAEMVSKFAHQLHISWLAGRAGTFGKLLHCPAHASN